MWLLKVPLFLLLIGWTKSKRDSQFALEEYYQEASQIYEKAKKIHLEYELATGKIKNVAERILNKKMDASALEEYVEMKISGGVKEQNDLLELFEKAEEVKTSDQLKDDIENGFTLMDGFSDLKNELSEFNLDDAEKDLKSLEERLSADYANFMMYGMAVWHDFFRMAYWQIENIVERFSPTKNDLSHSDKGIVLQSIYSIRQLADMSKPIHYGLDKYGFLNHLQGSESFNRMQDFTAKLNSMMSEVKDLDGLDYELMKVEKEMESLEILRDGNEVEEIKKIFQNLTTSSDFLKDFRISTNVHGQYRGIQHISPLLQKINSFSAKLKTFQHRTSRIFKEWSPVKNHFETTKIPSDGLTEKFSNFAECIRNFDFPLNFSMNPVLENKLKSIRSLDSKIQDIATNLKELPEITNSSVELIASKYTNQSSMDADYVTLLEEFLNENTWLQDFGQGNFKTHPSVPERNISNIEYSLLKIRDLIKEIDLENVRKVLANVNISKTFLECYSNLQTTASDMKELLELPGKVWNFDPKVLEGTVEVIGIFKEAHKMVEDIKEWKVASNPEIENFPFDGEDVKAVSDGIKVLETIRNVQNGWKMMKMLDMENSGIKDSWELLDSSLSQFYEILSSQKILNVSNVSFPPNLPIDTIKTFMQDEYQEDRRNDILNFLKEIQKLETDFPEYPENLVKMNEAMDKMREWENGKTNSVKKIVDCFEVECSSQTISRTFQLVARI